MHAPRIASIAGAGAAGGRRRCAAGQAAAAGSKRQRASSGQGYAHEACMACSMRLVLWTSATRGARLQRHADAEMGAGQFAVDDLDRAARARARIPFTTDRPMPVPLTCPPGALPV